MLELFCSAVLLFVVQAGEKNRYDQRMLQYSFQERLVLDCHNHLERALYQNKERFPVIEEN